MHKLIQNFKLTDYKFSNRGKIKTVMETAEIIISSGQGLSLLANSLQNQLASLNRLVLYSIEIRKTEKINATL